MSEFHTYNVSLMDWSQEVVSDSGQRFWVKAQHTTYPVPHYMMEAFRCTAGYHKNGKPKHERQPFFKATEYDDQRADEKFMQSVELMATDQLA